jgi:hypothetical protein
MKLKDILKIQSIVEDRATPYDILESGFTHYSKSKDEYIDLLDLHITHFIRIFLKQVEEFNKSVDKERIEEMQYTLNQMYEDLQTLKKDNGLDDLLSETERKKLNDS